MTINEFFNLDFRGASKALQGALGGNRIPAYCDFDNYTKYIDKIITGLKWGNEISKDIPTINASLEVREKWYVTKVTLIFSFKYSDDIVIRYYVGNSGFSCTLKKISFRGIGNYWKDKFDDLSKIGLNPNVSVIIPEVFSDNGRKGTIQNFLNNQYTLFKVQLDLAIGEITKILTDGSFINSWNSIGDTYEGSSPDAANPLKGTLGNILSSLISDNAKINTDDLALYVKSMARNFSEFNESSVINAYFSKGNCCEYRGIPKKVLENLSNLRKKIQRKSEIDKKSDELKTLLIRDIEDLYDTFMKLNPDLGLSREDLKSIVSYRLTKEVKYRYL